MIQKPRKNPEKGMEKPIAREEKSGGREVEFRFQFPGAREVCLAGDFNNWNPRALQLKQGRDGSWKARVKLAPGRYEYKVVKDGSWVQEVPGAEMVPNPFGTRNCVLKVK
jgi:1,4-alpha-glucan branching enzyme